MALHPLSPLAYLHGLDIVDVTLLELTQLVVIAILAQLLIGLPASSGKYYLWTVFPLKESQRRGVSYPSCTPDYYHFLIGRVNRMTNDRS